MLLFNFVIIIITIIVIIKNLTYNTSTIGIITRIE